MRLLRRPPGTARTLGQSMVEFALILPVLLAVLFGIIEFARLFAAWLSIQNAARFGVRYAVTGRFDPQYCVDAMAFYRNHDRNYRPVPPGTGFISASDDTAINPITGQPDPANDCNIPRGVADYDLKTELLQDYARLLSIWAETRAGALVINADYDSAVSGNYRDYLDNPTFYWDPPEGNTFNASAPHRGRPDRTGFFNIRICSYPRDNSVGLDTTNGPYFVPGFSGDPTYRYPDPCAIILQRTPTLRYAFRDHPGGPGERVQVLVTYRHPLIMPILSSIVPNVPLVAQREGIVESFRKSKDVILVAGQSGIIPTNTPTPTNTSTRTNTPTPTNTSTRTNTPTPTNTSTRTNTPTPTNTRTPTRTSTGTNTPLPTNTPTWTNTPTPTNTPTRTNTPGPSPTPTNTWTPTNTRTPTNTPTRTNTPLPTNTPTRTNTPPPTNTPTRTNTPTPTNTPTWTNTPGPSPTPTNTPTRTNTPTPTNTRTPTNTPTRTNTPTPTNTPTRTNTPTPTNTRTPTNTPTRTNTPAPPTNTLTPTPTNTPPIPCPYPWPLSETYCTGGYLNPGAPTPRP